ncbi:sigma-70 family RNA polymerase sigma factor [Neorhizobium sp. BT27B]|uniref:sigma-70 family RNA polymerase sigma factor n=1 Tax=Neorhizobium sp. BT27B TaxID=3142625 RepID=UPI003D2A2AE1
MTPANDNRPSLKRPAGFDAALEAYLPQLRKQANYMAGTREDGEVLLHETVLRMLRCAGNCRVETFRTWAQYKLLNTHSGMRAAARSQCRSAPTTSLTPANDNDPDAFARTVSQMRTPATQEAEADFSDAIRVLSMIKDGDLLLRRAMGIELKVIGGDLGVSKERVRQREEAARMAFCAAMQRSAA